MKKRHRAEWKVALQAFCFLVMIVVFFAQIVGMVFGEWDRNRPIPFDAQVWTTNHDGEKIGGLRSQMIEDLVHNYLRLGQSKTLVHRWLGASDQPQWNPTEDWEYYGYITGDFDFDGSSLRLQYDKQNRLMKIEYGENP